MKVNDEPAKVPKSFRLDPELVERMRDIALAGGWPPPPTQTEIVERGIRMVLRKLEKRRARAHA